MPSTAKRVQFGSEIYIKCVGKCRIGKYESVLPAKEVDHLSPATVNALLLTHTLVEKFGKEATPKLIASALAVLTGATAANKSAKKAIKRATKKAAKRVANKAARKMAQTEAFIIEAENEDKTAAAKKAAAKIMVAIKAAAVKKAADKKAAAKKAAVKRAATIMVAIRTAAVKKAALEKAAAERVANPEAKKEEATNGGAKKEDDNTKDENYAKREAVKKAAERAATIMKNIKAAAVKKAADKKAVDGKAPAKKTVIQTDSAKSIAEIEAEIEAHKVATKKATEKAATIMEAIKEASVKKETDKKAADKKAVDGKAPAKKTIIKADSAKMINKANEKAVATMEAFVAMAMKKVPVDERAAAKEVADKMIASIIMGAMKPTEVKKPEDKTAADKTATDRKAVEQMAANKKAVDEKTVDEKAPATKTVIQADYAKRLAEITAKIEANIVAVKKATEAIKVAAVKKAADNKIASILGSLKAAEVKKAADKKAADKKAAKPVFNKSELPPSRREVSDAVWTTSNSNVYVMYHSTKNVESVRGILENGFKPSMNGVLGPGIYVTRDYRKSYRYGNFTFKLLVHPGKVAIVQDSRVLALAGGWQKNGFDSAWVPPNKAWIHSGEEENCIKDNSQLTILGICKGFHLLPEDVKRMVPEVDKTQHPLSPHENQILIDFLCHLKFTNGQLISTAGDSISQLEAISTRLHSTHTQACSAFVNALDTMDSALDKLKASVRRAVSNTEMSDLILQAGIAKEAVLCEEKHMVKNRTEAVDNVQFIEQMSAPANEKKASKRKMENIDQSVRSYKMPCFHYFEKLRASRIEFEAKRFVLQCARNGGI